MNILIINSGSSSIKYQLIQMPQEEEFCSGLVERIGLDDTTIHFKTYKINYEKKIQASNHKESLKEISRRLMDDENGVIQSANEIDIVGHRVVHGGDSFSETTLINEEVKQKIKDLFSLAPLHNPPNLEGILVAEQTFPNARQVAIFDTAFHQSIPKVAYQYAIPKEISEKYNIRQYGFHGTSHKYVSEKANEYLGLSKSKLISIHLGNGCSITAVQDGKSVDHSMGFGPMNGLIMGTRSGDIDQSVIFYLMEQLNLTEKEINNLLQKQSGMLGLTGFSDLREIEQQANDGNKDCQLALAMNAYRIKKYIGSYIAVMNGLDAIVFTAGIGENSSAMRKMVCENMDYFGIVLDQEKNRVRSSEIREIQTQNANVKILVIPTNEELEIAKQSYKLISN